MDLWWALLYAMLLLGPFLLMQVSSTFKFHFKVVSYCVLCLTLSALAVPVCLLRNGGRTVDNMRIIRAFVRTMKYVYGLRFQVKGLENFQVDGPCVIISNHQSILDMMGLMEILPPRCVQIAKRELMFAGSVGLITYLGGVIYINRKHTRDAKSIMAGVAQAMTDDNLKVWVYPEGTRNNSGDLLPFKKGAFHLALQAKVPIIPVVYSSFTSFYDKKKSLFTGGIIKVEVLPKIDISGLKEEDISGLTERCFNDMRQVFFRLSGKPYTPIKQSSSRQ
ncbi:1-acyl-sn-glycerol-3-phosphate acyltransferase beta [Bufo gargarizans]|uniref:1-acyl-sn-glycerol-3-phosphate acyltransferase beta n=1 Tax=Bufo gargarizans TaxID=30331 RepID=UPI001CF1283B|nr:1-acyl-sn-glycerol-3-phosphate acyltransferase beta [Bufo gargarizans]